MPPLRVADVRFPSVCTLEQAVSQFLEPQRSRAHHAQRALQRDPYPPRRYLVKQLAGYNAIGLLLEPRGPFLSDRSLPGD